MGGHSAWGESHAPTVRMPRSCPEPLGMSDPSCTLSTCAPNSNSFLSSNGEARVRGRDASGDLLAANVPHRPRRRFRRGALHVTLRLRAGGLEPPHAPLLSRAPPGVRARVPAVRVPARALLGAGQPHPHDRRGAGCGDAGPGDEGTRSPHGPRAERVMSRRGPGIRGPVPRAPPALAARGGPRRAVRAGELAGARRARQWDVGGGADPFCSAAWAGRRPPLVAQPQWWMLRVGVQVGARPASTSGNTALSTARRSANAASVSGDS